MNRLIFIIALVSLVCGCQQASVDPSVPVTGKILLNGQALSSAMPPAGLNEIKFYSIDQAGNRTENFVQTLLEADGTFRVIGNTNKGLIPGKYRIVIRQWESYPELDKLGGKFDETNSKITWNITGPTDIQLDLANPPATEMGS